MSNQPSSPQDRDDRVDAAIAEFLEAIDKQLPLDRELWLERHADLRQELLDFLASEMDLGLSPNLAQRSAHDDMELTSDYPVSARSTVSRSNPLSTRAPERVGPYRLIRLLGAGGMGQVFEAVDASGTLVAVKLLSPRWLQSEESLQRFKQEGKIASSINHPRCVFVKAADEDRGQPYIVMELMTGKTLKDLSQESGLLPVNKAVHAIIDVLDGLDEAHTLGMIHRDIKPANCYLESNGRVKVGDFGLARSTATDSELTQTGAFIGTPLFASPEQVKGQTLDLRTDIYSVCATLYYLLTGRAPHAGTSPTSVIAKIVSEDAQPIHELNPNVPLLLEKVVMRGLKRDRKERFQSVSELRQALEPFVSGRQSIAAWGRRFAAYGVDSTITGIFGTVVIQLIPIDQPHKSLPFSIYACLLAPMIAYYLVCEGLGNATLGKRLLRLHIVDQKTGERPAPWRLILRSLSAVLLMGVLTDIFLYAFYSHSAIEHFAFLQWAGYLLTYTAMFSTLIWVRNGRMLMHDWMSGTMVVDRPTVSTQQELAVLAAEHQVPLLASTGYPSTIGDFAVQGLICSSENYAVLCGRDDRLGRDVWLHLRPVQEAELSTSRRECGRMTRLRWLTSGRHDKWRWDAYLACRGAPLKHWTTPDSPMSWQSARGLLKQLAEEIDKSATDGTRVNVQSLDQVWIDTRGRLVLVDWSPTNGQNSSLPLETESHDAESLERKSQRLLTRSDCALLCETARLALCGTSLPLADPPRSISAIVPLHVRELLQLLTVGREDSQRSMTTSELLEAIDTKRPAESTFENRAFGLGFALIPGLLMLGIVASLSRLGNHLLLNKSMDRIVATAAADWLLRSADESDYKKAVSTIAEFPTRDQIQEWLQNRQTLMAKWKKEYETRFASLGTFSEAVATGMDLTSDPTRQLDRVSFEWQQDNLTAVNWRKTDNREKIDLNLLAKLVNADSEIPTLQLLRRSPVYLFAIMLAPVVMCILWAGVSKGGISMRVSGLRVVDSQGRPASWLRTLLRAFIAGLPFLAIQSLIAWIDLFHPELLRISEILYQVQMSLFLVYAIVTIAFPRQAPQDWLLGTYLVPK